MRRRTDNQYDKEKFDYRLFSNRQLLNRVHGRYWLVDLFIF